MDFWKSIHAGAVKASQDLAAAGTPVEVIWKGPMREGDREQQVQVVEGFVTRRVNGIVLAPFDRKALARPVEEAATAGIPTVVIDSGLDSAAPVSVVASNNYHGGELVADEMARLLKEKGKVLMLRYQEGVASTEAREKGFEERMRAAHPGVEIVSSNQHGGATRDTAKTAAENLLNRYAEGVDGIFTPNESTTVGTLLALEDAGRAGKLRFIGFDTSPDFVPAMRAGKLDGIVVQNPFAMGELGVRTLVRHLRGERRGEAHRHRSHADHARNPGRSRVARASLASARPLPEVGAGSCSSSPASPGGSARPWRSTASISTCGPARSTR